MSDTPRTDVAEHNMGSIVEPHYVVDADFSRYLERELAEAQEELNDKRKFCYDVEQALDGLKGDYVEIIVAMRKDAEKYRYCFNSAAELAEAVTKERERCAKVCDEMDEAFVTIYGTDYTDFQNDPRYLQMAADAIRKGE